MRLDCRLLTAGKRIISKQSRERRGTSEQVCRAAAQMKAVEWVKEVFLCLLHCTNSLFQTISTLNFVSYDNIA